MKKTLIALAALAATGAFADNITIVGVVDAGVKATAAPSNAAGTSNNSNTAVAGNNIATTAVKFIGVEDIGGGMKASVLFEFNPNVAQSTTVNNTPSGSTVYTGTPFNGEQYVGLSGNFGEIKLGVPNSLAFNVENQSQPYVTGMGSGWSTSFGRLGTVLGGISSDFNGTTGSRIIRFEKTLQYKSPDFSGFTAGIDYSFGNDNQTAANQGQATPVFTFNSPTVTTLAAAYANGPLFVGFSTTAMKFGVNPVTETAPTGAGAITSTALGYNNTTYTVNILAANYAFGPAKIYAGYTTTKSDTTGAQASEDASSMNVGVKYDLSAAISLNGNYLTRTTNLTNQNNGKVIGAGADYNLSKRTTLYYRWELLDTNTNSGAVSFSPVTGATTATAGSVTVSNAAGIRFAF